MLWYLQWNQVQFISGEYWWYTFYIYMCIYEDTSCRNMKLPLHPQFPQYHTSGYKKVVQKIRKDIVSQAVTGHPFFPKYRSILNIINSPSARITGQTEYRAVHMTYVWIFKHHQPLKPHTLYRNPANLSVIRCNVTIQTYLTMSRKISYLEENGY